MSLHELVQCWLRWRRRRLLQSYGLALVGCHCLRVARRFFAGEARRRYPGEIVPFFSHQRQRRPAAAHYTLSSLTRRSLGGEYRILNDIHLHTHSDAQWRLRFRPLAILSANFATAVVSSGPVR